LQIPGSFAVWWRLQEGEAAAGREIEGKEFVKVFATTEPADLSGLRQAGYGGAPGDKRARGAFGLKIEQALGGGGGRRRGGAAGQGLERWTVATLSFLLRERRSGR
jgi:hypothetical protein